MRRLTLEFGKDGRGNGSHQRQRFEGNALAEEVDPYPGVAADQPGAAAQVAHLAVAVDHAPGQRRGRIRRQAGHTHRHDYVLDDVFMPLTHAVGDEVGRRAHAVGAAIADAAGILDHVLGIGALAIPDRGQIAQPGYALRRQGRIALCVRDQFCLHWRPPLFCCTQILRLLDKDVILAQRTRYPVQPDFSGQTRPPSPAHRCQRWRLPSW